MVQADEFTVSFDLGMNFDYSALDNNEISQIVLPDAVIADLMNLMNESIIEENQT